MNKITPKSTGIYERTLEKAKNAPPLEIESCLFKLEPEPLSPQMEERAKNELRETEEVVKQALADLRELLKGEPDLTVPDDDYYFAKFLRPCKWYPKPAFELIKRFYHYRRVHPRYCDNLRPSHDKAIFLSGVITPLPLRTNDGCRLVLIEGGRKWKPKEITLDQMFRGIMLLLDAAMVEPTTQVSGVHVMLDMDGLSLSHVTHFTPSFASAVLDWVQRCLPIRLKGVHIINQPFIFNMVFALFKPFFMEKLRKRVIFHGTDRQSLFAHINPECLPKRYGGQLETPTTPIGEGLWNYFMLFEDECIEADTMGYPKKK